MSKKIKIKQKAGIVACRLTAAGTMEFLLVTARVDPTTWVFPVGTVDPGETLREAAARECVEESGYLVDVGVQVAQFELQREKKHRVDDFTFFLGRLRGETAEYEHDRERRWVAATDAADAVVPVFRDVAETAVALLADEGGWLQNQ